MIIHIIGPSGSGKSTLGNKIKKIKNTVVIDTDDIDDPNCLKLINKYKFTNKSDEKNFYKEVGELNKKSIEKILNKNKDKNIVFVGMIHAGMEFIVKKFNYKFMIKIDAETLWKQYNRRTLYAINKNYKEITSLLNGKMSEEKLHIIFNNKFGIRGGFDCLGTKDLKKEISEWKKHGKKENYKYLESKDIYLTIKKLC